MINRLYFQLDETWGSGHERLIAILRAANIDPGEAAGEITRSLAPKDREQLRPVYRAAISQEIDWLSVPGFRGWLQFLSGHAEHVKEMRSTDAVLISAFFLKRAADKKLLFGMTPHYLLSGIYLEAEVLRRADLGDEVAERAAGFVFPDMLQLQIDYVDWIDGTKGTNRRGGSDVHLAALRSALTASRYLGDISKTLELVDEYEAVYIERGDTCSKCDSWRLNIADADFYAGG